MNSIISLNGRTFLLEKYAIFGKYDKDQNGGGKIIAKTIFCDKKKSICGTIIWKHGIIGSIKNIIWSVCEWKKEKVMWFQWQKEGTYLNVSTFDFGKRANIQDRSLSRQILELKGTQARPVQSETSGVTEHQPGYNQQEAVDKPHGQPLEQPHGQPESWSSQHLLWEDVHLQFQNTKSLID